MAFRFRNADFGIQDFGIQYLDCISFLDLYELFYLSGIKSLF